MNDSRYFVLVRLAHRGPASPFLVVVARGRLVWDEGERRFDPDRHLCRGPGSPLLGHGSGAFALAFSGSGRLLASGGTD